TMMRILTVLTVAWFVGAGTAGADAQADAKALVAKAMKAMGGEDKLAKLGTVAAKGKLTGMDGGQEFSLEFDGAWQGMEQYRADLEFQSGGNSFKGVLVVSGAKGWMKKLDDTKDAPPEIVTFIQNAFYAARMPLLLPALKDPAYTLAPLGE